jgi:hypothetical protein
MTIEDRTVINATYENYTNNGFRVTHGTTWHTLCWPVEPGVIVVASSLAAVTTGVTLLFANDALLLEGGLIFGTRQVDTNGGVVTDWGVLRFCTNCANARGLPPAL